MGFKVGIFRISPIHSGTSDCSVQFSRVGLEVKIYDTPAGGIRASQGTFSSYAPNFEKVGDILVSACPYVCMCVCVCVCVCMYSCSRYRLETSCMDSSWKNSQCIFLVFPELSPLVKLRPFDHTCDTFLKPNREIWNFWSGNLCLVSGGFHVANYGLFLPKLKLRNLVTLLEICFRASQCLHICQPK